MNKLVKCVFKGLILVAQLIILRFILHGHNAEIGEWVARIYYYTLGRWSYYFTPLAWIILLFRPMDINPTPKELRSIATTIYTESTTTPIWGDFFLHIFRNLVQPISLHNKKQ